MRFEYDVQEYEARIKLEHPQAERAHRVQLYRACVPFDFWFVRDRDVTYNRDAWDRYVMPYCSKLDTARARGYGLHFEGPNGVGKTMFASYVLVSAVQRGYTAYYITLLDLTFNLQRGMGDSEVMNRLEILLGSDFVVVDELTKERYKDGDSWMRTHVERVLKSRHDNSLPTIVATNADEKGIDQTYGSTVRSVLAGKYQHVLFDAGDYRDQLRERMRNEMGFDG